MSKILKPTPQELAAILADHAKWLKGEGGQKADLRSANLSSADLRCANLSSADFYGADLRSANLSSANLRSADLRSANLYGADLSSALNAELAKAQTEIVPREGEFTAWKKCAAGVLVKLLIPKDAARSNATGRKCRASKAVVLEIIPPEGTDPIQEAQSMYQKAFTYKLGETVLPEEFHPDRFVECAGGIHFFLTREEAQAFSL